MPNAYQHLRHLTIALAAIFVTSLASEASACSMMMKSGTQACTTTCGCCNSDQADVVQPVVNPVRTEIPCGTSNSDGCLCRSDNPVAPSTPPVRTSIENRSELGQVTLALAIFNEESVRPTLRGQQTVITQTPPKIPLYLRNGHLLF